MIVKNNEAPFEMPVKRFYFPCSVEFKCECGEIITRDFDDEYISYPEINSIFKVGMCCDECCKEYEFDMKLTINCEVLSEPRLTDE